ncbi:MAG: serine/threonine-protein kinase [Candidatus Zixiibacteriota bacterium]
MIPLAKTAVLNTHKEIASYHGYTLWKRNPNIGHGGQGWVYRAVLTSKLKVEELRSKHGGSPDIDNGLDVALKFYDEELTKGDKSSSYQRIKNELAITQEAPHFGIVRSYELCETETSEYRYLFLVMELIDGHDLERWMSNQWGNMEAREQDVRLVISSLCESLKHLHDNSVFHRDLKPRNIMIRDDGSVCVMDLGLAKHPKLPSADTPSKAFFGSIPYSSPQTLRGESYDGADDLYSLGAILFDMIYYPETIFGIYRSTHEGRTLTDLIKAVQEEDPFKLVENRPPIWANEIWLSLTRKLLEKQRERRPNCTEVLSSIPR